MGALWPGLRRWWRALHAWPPGTLVMVNCSHEHVDLNRRRLWQVVSYDALLDRYELSDPVTKRSMQAECLEMLF